MAAKKDRIAVIGAGIMGVGIAEVAAVAGWPVEIFDARDGAAAQAVGTIATSLSRRVERGRLTPGEKDAALSQFTAASTLAEVREASLVIEAIVESLEPKRQLMRSLEQIVAPSCVLATNTSSLSVTAIAAGCEHPRRIAGLHFFNPVPVMKVVEVIAGALTEDETIATLMAFAAGIGHRPVLAQDSPGFIVNHAGRGYSTEALRILAEGVAPPPVIDAIMRDGAGFRMGPFELLDLTGLDVSHPVMESIYDQFYQEPRFRPSPIARRRLAAGLLGRKVGRGFYEYADGRKVAAPPPPLEKAQPPASVRILPGPGEAVVRGLATMASATFEHDAALNIVPLIGEDATTAAVRLGLDASRTVGFDPLFGLDSHRTVVATPATTAVARAQAHALFTTDGKAASVVEDSHGAVAQRIVATIINIACDIAQQNIATPADIDAAVTLGLAYPYGPLAWGDRLGPRLILAILETQLKITGDPRYRPSLRLRRHAQLGLPLAQLDAQAAMASGKDA